MNGVDSIKERILEEARQEAARIEKEAEDSAARLKKGRYDQADSRVGQLKEQNRAKALDIKKRMLSVAELDMRKKRLSVKQEMIDKAFEGVLDAVSALPKQEYQGIIEEMLIQSAAGEEEVVFSAQDEGRLDQGFLFNVNEKLKSQDKKGELKLSAERGTFRGGFILRGRGVEINNSFESILRMARDEIEPQVAEILFSEG